MSDDLFNFDRVFGLASALRWSFHHSKCRWLEDWAPDPTCSMCKAKQDWDAYIDEMKSV